ncbi:MAG: hypothetical protein ATN31_05890 [Candidatus Epulonipiscioides saccharophilum]|nr:MAG: hypothetical protein ATN31_05890 [Epulopiscium sp. AS2M-Bin001]
MAEFQIIAEQFSMDNIIPIFIRIMIATFFSGILGILSGRKGRAAGLKTHILVCVGATTAMLTNQYIYSQSLSGDPTRIAAQVISGIGFIGAGTIIVTGKQQIKGVTTAASLWTCACLGLAIGTGYYSGAFISWLFILITLTFFRKYETKLHVKMLIHEIYMEVSSQQEISDIINYYKSVGCSLYNLDMQKAKISGGENMISLFVTVSFPHGVDIESIIDNLRNATGIHYIEIL